MRAFIAGALVFAACGGIAAQATGTADALPWPYNLARQPDIRTEYIETAERLVRWLHRHQNDDGAIIDPLLRQEHQYTTPYYAFALFSCRAAGRCEDLEASFHDAMDHCTAQVEAGSEAIPDQHGEFFLASLGELVYLIEAHPERSRWIDARSLSRWRSRLSVPVEHVIEGLHLKLNNHRAYAMKGEFYRGKTGLVSPDAAREFIEDAWENRGIRYRINEHGLFQDWNGEPQSMAVEAVGRANLLPIAIERPELLPGFDVESGAEAMARLMDPTGQCPPNGRTDNHVFNDLLYAAIFESLHGAELEDSERYGTYAALAFESAQRWVRKDAPYEGIFSITKNHLDPAERVGYQPASRISNYTATAAVLAAQCWWNRPEDPERSTPRVAPEGSSTYFDSGMGGVSWKTHDVQVFANLRGDTVPKYGDYWTAMGIVRLSRANWDSRLGPGDGHYDAASRMGLSLAPTWQAGRRWVRLAETAEHYRGAALGEEQGIVYAPVTGVGGPMFEVRFSLYPQGVLFEYQSPSGAEFGVSLPLLVDDGRELIVTETPNSVGVRYPEELSDGSEQHFIVLNRDAVIQKTEARVLSSYGWLQEYRARATDPVIRIFAYMRREGEMEVAALRGAIDANYENIASNPFEEMRRVLGGPNESDAQ